MRTWFVVFVSLAIAAHADDFQGATHLTPYDEDTIAYSKTTADNAISRLQSKINGGDVQLAYDQKWGYLPSLLQALNIDTNSQMLVFSKTSFQRDRINPHNPRALYFNDDVYVGFIPGSPILEVSVADPRLGGVFYSLDQQPGVRPKFERNDQCLECHASAKTMGVPGHLVRSFETDASGSVELVTGVSQVTHRTPFEERWGGWYVTGKHGSQTHRGNLIGKAAFKRQAEEPNHAGNADNLARYFETSRYPMPSSDIVALMTVEHQLHMHNFITRVNYAATLGLAQYGHVNYLKSVVEGFVRYLLFVDEAPLKEPIEGNTNFAAQFAKLGPRDSKGRSLRDFDLHSRLFKHPCSYLIYSEAFDAIPKEAREKIYQRLWDVLTGKDNTAAYASLTPESRQAILEILRETKKDLPEYWHNQQQ